MDTECVCLTFKMSILVQAVWKLHGKTYKFYMKL